MHPFFQPKPHPQSENIQEASKDVSGFDGAHHITQNDGGAEQGYGTKGEPIEGLCREPTVAHLYEEGPEQKSADPDRHRRKRRRTTPPEDEEPEKKQGTGSDEPWLQQLQDAAATVHAQHEEKGEKASQGEEQSLLAPIYMTNRRSSRLSSTSASPKVLETSNEDANDAVAPAVRSTQVTTPKKKMIQLSANGKLRTSPRTHPKSTESKQGIVVKPGKLNMKGGRLVPSMPVALSYANFAGGKETLGSRINQILAGQKQPEECSAPIQQNKQHPTEPSYANKITHPFFLGKAGSALRTASTHSVCTTSSTVGHDENAEDVPQPKPWNDIKFGSVKPAYARDIDLLSAVWPPLEYQSVLPHSTQGCPVARRDTTARRTKRKGDVNSVSPYEDVLEAFGVSLQAPKAQKKVQKPERLTIDSEHLLTAVGQSLEEHGMLCSDHSATAQLRKRVQSAKSAFDRGTHAGPLDWAHEYAPKETAHVLQPQAIGLREWLNKLKVHNVQAKLAESRTGGVKRAKKRGRPKREQDGLDDFIVSSDDDQISDMAPVKNAVVITGPHGCGKTASVYAAAHELGFEVFEIHPGMRRTAKDIFDKVGDMTENHLVQPLASSGDRQDPPKENPEPPAVDGEVATGRQETMASFLGSRTKKKALVKARPETPQPETEKSRKQSLILFEEVDVLFEEDKSFWAGVISLMHQSRRPIILTCNDLAALPLEELQLHTIFRYVTPPRELAVPYLSLVAAAEGHVIDTKALQQLYFSKKQDLRASLTELSYWCQMTVGSQYGGLDWMRSAGTQQGAAELRIVSKGTYHQGLDLVPEETLDHADLLRFAHNTLDITTSEWQLCHVDRSATTTIGNKTIDKLQDSLIFAEARSCVDLVGSTISPLLDAAIGQVYPNGSCTGRADLIKTILSPPEAKAVSMPEIMAAFEGITDDVRTFPPPTGRTAPSLDTPVHSLVTEVAPYVRCIVAFDVRLEEQRNELAGGSQGKRQRTTRAARAALEGGSKAFTRRERWFPKDLDFDAVIKTGNGWPVELDIEAVDGATPDGMDSSQTTVDLVE